MSASHSTSKQSDSTSTVTNTSLTTVNKNLSGNSGLVANADEGATLNLSYAPITISTDANAVEAGRQVANAGISAAVTAVGTNAQLAADAIHQVIQATSTSADRAESIVRATAADALEGGSKLLQSFGSTLSQYQLDSNKQLGNVVSALNESYRQASTSTDERVQQIAEDSTKLVRDIFQYGLIALGVAVGAFLLTRGKKVLA